jgi:flavin-dependent dehydrogenase
MSIYDFAFSETTTEGFFNEFEQDLVQQIQSTGSGVYKLTQDKQGQFTAAEVVTEVSEAGAEVIDGRVTIIGDETDYLYVKFVG